MNNELMTLKEVAEFLKVKPATIRYWIEKGIICSFIKLNGQNNYRFQDAKTWKRCWYRVRENELTLLEDKEKMDTLEAFKILGFPGK